MYAFAIILPSLPLVIGIEFSSGFSIGIVEVFVDDSGFFTVLIAEALVKLDSFNTKSKIVMFFSNSSIAF